MPADSWTLRLSRLAQSDLSHIQSWTARQFGAAQARHYAHTLAEALNALRSGPAARGATRREDLGRGIHTLHVARKGHKGRHFIVFRTAVSETSPVIDVLRVLHDAMDLQRHLSGEQDR